MELNVDDVEVRGMTPVEEYRTKFSHEKDDLETLSLEEGKTKPKGKTFKTAVVRQKMSIKERHIAEAAARAWVDAGGHSWNDFTQNTTFHGIKYIFDPSSYTIRK